MEVKRLIETSLNQLLNTKPFYAHFFLSIQIVYDKYNVPTAGATITPKGPMLIFNSQWMGKLNVEECAGVIEHEILHLLFDHVNQERFKDKNLNCKVANIAKDCAINQYIEGLPEGCITLEVLNKSLDLNMNAFDTWEYYYNQLMQKAEELEQSGQGTHDDHDSFSIGDGDGFEKMGKHEKDALLKASVDQAANVSKGNLPSVVQKVYSELFSKQEISWKQILSNFVARNVSTERQDTRKKVNRRFGVTQPGKKKKRELTLGVCLDSSGSISEEVYLEFLGEVQRLSKLCSKIHIVDADCEVQDVYTLKRGSAIKMQRYGNGGTACQPAISECLKYQCDAIVYFGDGDSADTPVNPNVPFLWVISGNSKPPGDFGGVVRL
jgi:predicted metal-dependent peptidase